ncbi:MAG TPA: CPBP family intramembrane glutamic endopeptidase, partial [Pseudonocardia sp.]|nr:CPBP family intramembrane glutamic endopeptidase [Pseudonocardia sp.]
MTERVNAKFRAVTKRDGEPRAALRHRRRAVGVVGALAATLLGRSLTAEPGSRQFYAGTLSVAALYAGGGFASGKVRRGKPADARTLVVEPVVAGLATFGIFYAGARVCRRIPILRRAIASVLSHADEGFTPAVVLTTVATGAAEEVFFRGAVYDAIGEHHPVAASTAAWAVATAASRNPALVFASVLMGSLFGVQRRRTGGVAAPTVTHLTWSVLMLRYLPPLFETKA